MKIERRLHPRYLLDAACEFCWESEQKEQEHAVSRTINISRTGVQLQCTEAPTEALYQQTCYPPECELKVVLPAPWPVVSARARILTKRRLARDCFHLGLEFIRFTESGEQDLVDYLATDGDPV